MISRNDIGPNLLAAAALAGTVFALAGVTAEESKPDEHRVKAALVFNVLKFVEWPASSFPKPESALELCTLGSNPLTKALGDLKGKSIAGREISVRAVDSAAASARCHALYVSQSEKDRLTQVVDAASKNHVLSIGDTDGFAKSGVAVNFYVENEKVRFEANPEAARRAGLSLSSKLLKLARIVDADGGEQK